jgi:hypothetical protein
MKNLVQTYYITEKPVIYPFNLLFGDEITMGQGKKEYCKNFKEEV